MSVYFYDEAIVKKLKSWTENSHVHIYSPSDTKKLFEVIADTTNDKPIKLPIICLNRTGGYTITNINKKPLTFDGKTLEATDEKTMQLNAIPITIQYQIDVYCKYLKECDAYIRNLIFNIINYPTFELVIPYQNTSIIHYGNLRVAENVEDNSSIPERLISGQFSRMSLTVDIDDAYLWDVRIRDIVSIDLESSDLEVDKYPDKEASDYERESLS